MNELSKQNEDVHQRRNDRPLKVILVLVVIVALACPSFYCWIIPSTTGQFCPDIASGHVPIKAEEIFLARLFEAIENQDYKWLETVSTEKAFIQLKEIQPVVTRDFITISWDDLSGMYERVIQFKTGTEVYLTFHGNWTDCPDFSITEQEVFENIRLTYIEIRE